MSNGINWVFAIVLVLATRCLLHLGHPNVVSCNFLGVAEISSTRELCTTL